MNNSFLLSLVNNIALLLAIALLLDLTIYYRQVRNDRLYQYPLGLMIGGIGVVLMMTPWTFAKGIIFDTRSILLGISGIFFGLTPTIIAMLITGVFRYFQGGVAMWTGICVIIASGSLGLVWRYYRHRELSNIQPWQLYLFGLLVHVVMLVLMFLMPLQTALQVVNSIAFGVLAIYPLGTTLLGMLMINRLRRNQVTKRLQDNETRLQNLVEILQHKRESSTPILKLTLEKAILQTESKVGFIFLFTSATGELKLLTWSKTAMTQCNIPEQNICTTLEESGLWGEAIRRGEYVILNDYEKSTLVKKGIPEGHIAINRFLSVPIKSGDEIVGLVGVANKESDYLPDEATQLSVLMNTAWLASERIRVEEDLYQSKERYKTIINSLPKSQVAILDNELRYQFLSGIDEDRVSGLPEEFQGKTIFEVMDSNAAEAAAKLYRRALQGETVQMEGEKGDQYYNTLAAPLRNSAGEVTQVLVLSMNISERHSSEIELKRLFNLAEQSRLALLSVIEDQKRAEEQISQLNLELEKRVQERTNELQLANQELEAFSYSVSHDLRAPLRAMDGFSTAVIAEYHDRLDEKGQHYLNRIQEASKRMGQLINDLLDLSRVSRVDLTKVEINLSTMANEVADSLKIEYPSLAMEFHIENDLMVFADRNLMRILLDNLLGNAVKFSGQREKAIISLQRVPQDGKSSFVVRDNGVGFDMEYAGKLFAPFQRLHGVNEFPGTGIGLATVQRIIHRHKGEIWAKATLDHGAEFFFTLGVEE